MSASSLLVLLGLALIGLNLVGGVRGLGLYPVSRQFPPGELKLGRTRPIRDVSALQRGPSEGNEDYAARLTEAINAHMIHSMGSEFPRVSPFHNWILWTLGCLLPSRFRYLELRNARYALQRGFGLCSQSTLALVDLLSRAGMRTAIAALDGHVVVTAETSPERWIVLDPDYGVTIPLSLEQIRAQAPMVIRNSYGADYAASVTERLEKIYAGSHELVPHPNARDRFWAACEHVVFSMKWIVPILLVGIGLRLFFEGR